jgi:hypothetical protein
MPDKSAATDQVKGLLAGLSDANVRELCIDGLRAWRKSFPDRTQVDVRDIGWEALRSLSISKRVTLLDPAAQKEAVHAHLAEPWLSGVSEFVSWLVRAGLAWPMGALPNAYPYWLHLTRAGVRFLDAIDDHPLRPGFLDRVAGRCPGLPEEVLSLLADASRCLDAGLMRPAIVLMGVAYEVAVERVAESLVKKGQLKQADLDDNAAKLLAKVRTQVKGTLLDKEHQFAADAACDFADQLRRRRNDGAHTTPTYGFEDREEAEEFLVSAGRHLPHLWRMF